MKQNFSFPVKDGNSADMTLLELSYYHLLINTYYNVLVDYKLRYLNKTLATEIISD
jgi:hypothetical protein